MRLNSTEIPAPLAHNFNITPVEIGVTNRTASGRRVKEIVSVKNNYSLTYQGLKYSNYKIFLDYYLLSESVEFTYLDNDVEVTKTVDITSVPRGIFQEKSVTSHSITITMEEV